MQNDDGGVWQCGGVNLWLELAVISGKIGKRACSSLILSWYYLHVIVYLKVVNIGSFSLPFCKSAIDHGSRYAL